ncbi:Myb-like DNA-binding domain containing protein [Trichomonas vaginalis G3]|uniref:Myb-like DNA-binding domain containing protein n=1 Tax=Trichomonas vaginalis (strain ATCC PRA-98 / G3) TaxID=412133 RepID=A2FDB5_TRIV3|nr:RNA polymerase II transcription regulator recruiting protein [Trichomonas vaginalis G3]EAX97117.1 Myb-like DNA-binding domain containing protein [Trichomonas vaginalis G3]KAI5513009.1 RNA polymerase II transcription regulator recruiting protein [Trichomonas vaginalis G3]|eukprot:XP_001310047.1 Myb-like DNA-binding domain containing protein [Trichomonas vaginalis G3]
MQAYALMSRNRVNCRFSAKEDKHLTDLVNRYGENDWKTIANKMPGRNKRQCKDRWTRYLSPNVNNGPWTEEEETKLLSLVTALNHRWTEIAKHFQGRNDSQVKNKYHILTTKTLKEQPTTTINVEKIATSLPKESSSGSEFEINEFQFDDLMKSMNDSNFDIFNFTLL